MPDESEQPGGGTPPTPPPDASGMQGQGRPEPEPPKRDADATGDAHDADQERRDAALAADDLRKALNAERRAHRESQRELKALQDAERERQDAGKSELERAQARADEAERKVALMERESLARQVAAESGIAALWHRLSGDDVRALRADAQKLREELGIGAGALDGGVRGVGGPVKPQSMDEIIRAGVRR